MISQFLTNGNVGSIASDAQKQVRQQINERWEKLGFTKGLQGYLKENMSVLFENQAGALLKEATDASNSGSFETVVFPLVRRVFSRLLANDIVSIQAMNMAVGKLFFIKPVTSERKIEVDENGVTTESHYGLMGYERTQRNESGATVNRYYLPDEVIDAVDTAGTLPEVTQYMKKSLYDLFYNDFLYDNSKGKIRIKVGSVTPKKMNDNGDYENLTSYGVGADGSVRNIVLEVKGFSSYRASKLIGPDGNEMDTEAFLASLKVVTTSAITDPATDKIFTTFEAGESVPFRLVTQRYGKGIVEYGNACDADGKLYIELDLAKPTKAVSGATTGTTIDGFIGINPDAMSVAQIASKFQVAWAQYDSLELETEIGEVSFELSEVTVSVEERKLRATWSPEMAQDVAAFHNIDAEAELTAILSEQIAAEVDREVLRDLRKGAAWQLSWDYNGWRRQAGFSTNYTQKDWNQMLMTKINQISAQVHKSTLRGGANFVVVSTEISALLNDLEYFHVTDANAEANTYSMGIEKIGSLQSRYQIYVDPYSPANSALIGHKGDSLLDTGYIYAPYIPMQLTPVIYNPSNFAPVRGIMTRYAKKLVSNKFYGQVKVFGLQTWNIAELR